MTDSIPWLAFGTVVVAMLVCDRRAVRDPTPRAAVAWTGAWFALAAAFGGSLALARGAEAGCEFFTAYVVEQALSVDNLFVMLLVFARFRVPRAAQRRVLSWGIAGVVVLRGAMIASGTALVGRFHVLVYVLGAFLLVAAVQLARRIGQPDDAPDAAPLAARVRAVLARFIPITGDFAGDRFTVVRAGVRFATPLLLVLLVIELADAVFALDSIPAVLGVTTDPLIVFTSNLFAVLGLRSLFCALSGALARLRYLPHALVGVLGLVGAKMLLGPWWPAPTWLSLALVLAMVGVAVAASLALPIPTQETRDAEPT